MHRCAELYSFEWRLNFGNRTQADRATHANVQVYSSYGLYSSYGKIGYISEPVADLCMNEAESIFNG